MSGYGAMGAEWGGGQPCRRAAGRQAGTHAAPCLMTMVLRAVCTGIMPVLVLERPVYLRERSDGLYRPITYLIYKAIEELAIAWAAAIPVRWL